MKCVALAVLVCAMSSASFGQQPDAASSESIEQLAARVAGAGTEMEKTERLVKWINTEFQWTATDYQRRTPEEIIARRGGNCAELARVLARLLQACGVKHRMVREINIQPPSDSRQHNAERLIATKGNQLSVFGRRHNDHTWLEIFDSTHNCWAPADPAVGVVGIGQWEAARLGLGQRPKPPVTAVEEITRDMIVPFTVTVAGNDGEDRSSYYLIDEFDRANGGRLAKLPAWKEWTELVCELSRLGRQAFMGEVNLHEHAAKIERLAAVYEQLREQATHIP